MGVPLPIGRPAAGNDDGEAHAVFDQSPRQQTPAAIIVRRLGADAIKVERLLGFAGQIEQGRGLGLHAKGQFLRPNAGAEFIVVRCQRGFVEIAN